MHIRFQALLGILLVLGFCFSGGGCASGQPAQTSDAQNQIAKAFVLVQQADMAGALPKEIATQADNTKIGIPEPHKNSKLSTSTVDEDRYVEKSALSRI